MALIQEPFGRTRIEWIIVGLKALTPTTTASVAARSRDSAMSSAWAWFEDNQREPGGLVRRVAVAVGDITRE